MKNLLILLIMFFAFTACNQKSKLEKELLKINSTVKLERYDLEFAQVNAENFSQIKAQYPFMFAKQYPDTFWLKKASDTLEKQLFSEVAKTFKNTTQLQTDIEGFFNHLKYYFPGFKVPRIITTTSDVDYKNKVIITDTINLIALDTYLGENHEFYKGIPVYLRQGFNKSQIVVDLASNYATKYITTKTSKTFLETLIFYGKKLYFMETMLPKNSAASLLNYTPEQWEWSRDNETYIWLYFIEHELLYSTDTRLLSRFINPAPFSKFYLEEIDSKSPGKIGQYMGWQIVKAYMENNNTKFQDMLKMSPEEIFNKSKFKPQK